VQYNEGDIFRVSVPSNWREHSASSAVTFAPDGAIGQVNGQGVFTHGVEIGVARNAPDDLEDATDELIDSLRQNNPGMSRPSPQWPTNIDRIPAVQTTLENESDITNRTEVIRITTTLLDDGSLFYFIAVAPEDELRVYDPVFQRVLNSIRFIR
jgi:hypothetical protein